MLIKLMKHDFKSTGKILLPLHILLVAITLLGSIPLGARILQRDELIPLALILLLVYILMVITIGFVTLIYLIVQFYRSMFSAQGYLTFTLPASPWLLLHSKTLVAFLWCLLDSILAIGSAFFLVGTGFGFRNVFSVISELFRVDTSFQVGSDVAEFSMELTELLGYTLPQFAGILAVAIFISCFCSIAMGFAAVSIGQLYSKHKVAGAIVAYVALSMITQIIITIISFMISFRAIISTAAVPGEMAAEHLTSLTQSIYQPMLPATMLVQLILSVICYVAAGIIINKKVNLD